MRKITIWIASGIITIVMLMGGVGKLMGNAGMLESFARLGLPVWFGYFIGACEVAAAIGLWVPRWAAPAAAGVVLVMVGAVYYHVTYPPIQAGIPA